MSRLVRWLMIASACALIASAVPVGMPAVAAQSGPYTFSTEPIDWAACPDAPVAGLECAVYTVPLDYRDPSGTTIELALRRMPASDSPIGTLFFNPGGPGGTGTGQFVTWLPQFPEEVRQRFHLVSWDPRGIVESTGVQCFESVDAEGAVLGDLGAFPVSYAEQEAHVAGWQTFAQTCAATQADLLAHVSTADTARDLEQLRIASGDEDLNYWGVSYGTFLGATYANLFPDNIRTLVLDGNLSPLAWTADGNAVPQDSLGGRIGSRQVADVFGFFLQTCTAAGPDACAFAESTVALTTQKWTDLMNRLSEGPITLDTADGPRVVELETLIGQVSSGMDIVWPIAGAAGWSGNAAALQAIYEAAIQQAPASAATPTAATPETAPAASPAPVTGTEAYAGAEQALGVTCGDAARPTLDRIPSLAAEAQAEAGYFGLAVLYNDFPCTFWDVEAADPYRGPWTTELSASPLIVNTTHDPSTPMQNAEEMATLLPGSVLLRVNGYGHTSLLNTSACANAAISAYLVGERLPAPDTYCAQERQPFQD